jgi:putative OPT family oligopeptide transporter
MASVAQGVFGGGLPWGMIGGGAVLGAGIIAIDLYLERRGSAWRAPVLAVAVGVYLPLELTMPILAGGLVAHVAARRTGGAAASSRHGLLFAAGLITGEALVGILMAIPIVLSDDPNVFAVPFAVPVWMGLLVVVAVTAGLYRVATAAKQP